eukprot:m.287827 g.287827  ORF g.287827 m.287827 type:complete len:157 (-) comp16220_c0_seq21:754-1224(-)
MDLYRPVISVTADGSPAAAAAEASGLETAENSIRVTVNGKIRKYLTAAKKILNTDGINAVIVYGEGRAVTKAISCAEVLKHRMLGLHQITSVGMTKVTDVWEPKLDVEEDMDRVQVIRRVPNVTITLSLDPLDPQALGYQPPLPESEVTPDTSMDE